MSVPIERELLRVMTELDEQMKHPLFDFYLNLAHQLNEKKIIGKTVNNKTGEETPLYEKQLNFIEKTNNPVLNACIQWLQFTEIFDRYIEEKKIWKEDGPIPTLSNYTMAESKRLYDEFIEANKW